MISLLGARLLPYIFHGLTKNNICREAARTVRGKWDGTVLRYQRTGSKKANVFNRNDAKRIARREKNERTDKPQINAVPEAAPLAGLPVKREGKTSMTSVNFFTDYGSDYQYLHAPTVPLHRMIAKLGHKLMASENLLNNTEAPTARSKPDNSAAASAASPKPENSNQAVSSRQAPDLALLEKSRQRRQEFFEEMAGKRRDLSTAFANKFSRFMGKSGTGLSAAKSSCDAVYQEIYTREFDSFLDHVDTGRSLEFALRSAHGIAARVAVERLEASGSIDHRNYAKFLSAFRLVYVRNTPPPIPPRTGKVAYRPNA
ncbi:MAG TPA: hypothetical protein VGN04_08905 [Herbaspirillum sp.]|jgi:hypothetical protein